MPSGNTSRANWFLALAGIQAGVIGGLVLLGYVAFDSLWHQRSIWTVPNLLASTFYGQAAYRSGFRTGTSAGLALAVFIYGALGLLFALLVRDHGTKVRVLLAGVIFGVGWFFLSYDVLWKHVNPLVHLYSPDRAMLVGHLLYGSVLGGRFPAYLRSIRTAPVLAAQAGSGSSAPPESGAPPELPGA